MQYTHCTIQRHQKRHCFHTLYLYLSQIHQRLIESGTWGSKLKEFSWRIDVKTKAKHIEQLNTPTSIMELQVESEDRDEVCVCVGGSGVCVCVCVYVGACLHVCECECHFIVILACSWYISTCRQVK